MDFMAEENRKNKKLWLEFLDSTHNNDILYLTRSAHMEERQVEVDDMEDEDASDSESTKSLKMEMVEVIKLHMSVEMPEGKIFFLTLLLQHLRHDHTLHEIQSPTY